LFGRVVDGVADYISSVAIFLGIGMGLAAVGQSQWWLVVVGGLSSAVHAFFFDQYQSEFISTVRGEKNFLEREVKQFTVELRRMQTERRNGFKSFILKLYLRYLGYQKRSSTKTEQQLFEQEHYRTKNLVMIRLWSFLGPTTNRTLLIVCALAGRVDIFLWIIGSIGNAWLIVCYLRQREIHRTLSQV